MISLHPLTYIHICFPTSTEDILSNDIIMKVQFDLVGWRSFNSSLSLTKDSHGLCLPNISKSNHFSLLNKYPTQNHYLLFELFPSLLNCADYLCPCPCIIYLPHNSLSDLLKICSSQKIPETLPKKVTGYKINRQNSIIFPYVSNEDVETEVFKIPFIIAKKRVDSLVQI